MSAGSSHPTQFFPTKEGAALFALQVGEEIRFETSRQRERWLRISGRVITENEDGISSVLLTVKGPSGGCYSLRWLREEPEVIRGFNHPDSGLNNSLGEVRSIERREISYETYDTTDENQDSDPAADETESRPNTNGAQSSTYPGVPN